MTEPLSRRDFLKVVVSLGAVAAGGATLCKLLTPEDTVRVPDYKEINDNEKLLLSVDGSKEFYPVYIRYLTRGNPLFEKLRIRRVDDQDKYLPFNNGGETVRKVGEIIDINLKKVRKNSELSDEIRVGVYPTSGVILDMVRRRDFPDDREMYALEIVTARYDYLQDGRSEVETNKKPPAEDWMNIHEFGRGLAVGELRKSLDGSAYTFEVWGYTHDARALEEVK